MKAKLASIVLCTIASSNSGAQVLADEACPLYAVDAAAFASCDGEHAAAFNRVDLGSALLPAASVPASKRGTNGLHVDARHAHQLKNDNPERVMLVDVRSRVEVGIDGLPANVDAHVPYLETVFPLQWDDSSGGWAMARNPSFARDVGERLARFGGDRNTPILLLCRAGEYSARAADELAALGYSRAISVIDGFEGDVGPDGRRSVNGWKNAGLPWTARPLASLVYGVR